MPKTTNTKTERVHLSLNPELVRRLDEECEKCGESRSVFARRALITYLDSLAVMHNMPALVKLGQEAMAAKRQGSEAAAQISLADLAQNSAP